jgi:hypothetical protein
MKNYHMGFYTAASGHNESWHLGVSLSLKRRVRYEKAQKITSCWLLIYRVEHSSAKCCIPTT